MVWLTRSRTSSTSTPQQDASSAAGSIQGTPARDRPRMKSQQSRGSSKHAKSVVPPLSPTLSAISGISGATRASKMEWGSGVDAPAVVITRGNMRDSLDTYENLLKAAKAYRNAMLALATATSDFASALEDCARQKGAAYVPEPSTSRAANGLPDDLPGLDDEVAEQDADDEEDATPKTAPSERLMSAAGLHHVMSNQQQLLSDTFYKSFEIPLLERYDNYRSEVQERQMQYEKETSEKSQRIRDTEAENIRAGRKKQRDLASFRRALLSLQSQVDDLDRMKADFYQEVLTGEQENWTAIAAKIALIVRAQIDSADRIVTKGSSDATIESMVQTILDPFNVYDQANDGHIFSIVAPLGITSPASSSGSPHHPATGLARSKIGIAATANNVTESSPASTAHWADDQKRLANGYSDENEVTPRRQRKDQLSWISENDEQKELARNAELLTGRTESPASSQLPPDSDNGW